MKKVLLLALASVLLTGCDDGSSVSLAKDFFSQKYNIPESEITVLNSNIELCENMVDPCEKKEEVYIDYKGNKISLHFDYIQNRWEDDYEKNKIRADFQKYLQEQVGNVTIISENLEDITNGLEKRYEGDLSYLAGLYNTSLDVWIECSKENATSLKNEYITKLVSILRQFVDEYTIKFSPHYEDDQKEAFYYYSGATTGKSESITYYNNIKKTSKTYTNNTFKNE